MHQDQAHNQYMREATYCGRFKAWQLALIFMGGLLMLFGALPAVCHLLGVM